MNLKFKNIKNFIRSIRKNELNQIIIKNNKTNILINKAKKRLYNNNNYQLYKTINKKQNSDNYNSFKFQEDISLPNNTFNKDLLNKSSTKTKANTEQSTSYSTIISPMVGTFYRSPAPNEKPFIENHDIVQIKQTVCIIEAMKLMNEIEAEVNGEIVEILVNDGDIVDCGQALMKVKIK